jgi:hypothetical protein
MKLHAASVRLALTASLLLIGQLATGQVAVRSTVEGLGVSSARLQRLTNTDYATVRALVYAALVDTPKTVAVRPTLAASHFSARQYR